MAIELKSVQTPADRCRLYRRRAKMTQAQLAEAIGCSVDLISAIERGSRSLTIKNAVAMSAVLGVRKECLLCFDDYETDSEKSASPYAEMLTTLQMAKKAFSMYVGIYGCNIVLIDNSQYKDLSANDFLTKSEKERIEILSNISEKLEMFYYSFQDRAGAEIGRCSAAEYNTVVKEIADFAEFKIKKLIEGSKVDG